MWSLNVKTIKPRFLAFALATMAIASSAYADTSYVFRVYSAGIVAPGKTPTPKPDVFDDGQFSVSAVPSYSALVGTPYTVSFFLRNKGAPIAMGSTPMAASGANVVGPVSVSHPTYCSVLKANNQTLRAGGNCMVSLSMTVPAPGTTTGYASIGGTRVSLVSVGYTSSEVSSFAATPNVYTTTEAQSGYFADYFDVTLKNTSTIAGGFSVVGLVNSSSLVQHISNNCESVAAGGTCVVKLLYDNQTSPGMFSYPLTILGTVRNADGSKTAWQRVPLTLAVTPRAP